MPKPTGERRSPEAEGVPAAPAHGGARTLEELEAYARKSAGLDHDPAALAACDKPKKE